MSSAATIAAVPSCFPFLSSAHGNEAPWMRFDCNGFFHHHTHPRKYCSAETSNGPHRSSLKRHLYKPHPLPFCVVSNRDEGQAVRCSSAIEVIQVPGCALIFSHCLRTPVHGLGVDRSGSVAATLQNCSITCVWGYIPLYRALTEIGWWEAHVGAHWSPSENAATLHIPHRHGNQFSGRGSSSPASRTSFPPAEWRHRHQQKP